MCRLGRPTRWPGRQSERRLSRAGGEGGSCRSVRLRPQRRTRRAAAGKLRLPPSGSTRGPAGRGRGRLVPVDSSAAAAPNRAAGGRKSSSAAVGFNRAAGGRKSSSAAVGFNRAAGGRDSSSAAAAPTAIVPDLTAKRAAEGREPADSAVTGQVGGRSGRRPRRSRGGLYSGRAAGAAGVCLSGGGAFGSMRRGGGWRGA